MMILVNGAWGYMPLYNAVIPVIISIKVISYGDDKNGSFVNMVSKYVHHFLTLQINIVKKVTMGASSALWD